MFNAVLRVLFRCSHRHISRPITPAVQPGAPLEGTYVVCLDCGMQLAYDWEHMRLGREVRPSTNRDKRRHQFVEQADRHS